MQLAFISWEWRPTLSSSAGSCWMALHSNQEFRFDLFCGAATYKAPPPLSFTHIHHSMLGGRFVNISMSPQVRLFPGSQHNITIPLPLHPFLTTGYPSHLVFPPPYNPWLPSFLIISIMSVAIVLFTVLCLLYVV